MSRAIFAASVRVLGFLSFISDFILFFNPHINSCNNSLSVALKIQSTTDSKNNYIYIYSFCPDQPLELITCISCLIYHCKLHCKSTLKFFKFFLVWFLAYVCKK